MHWNHRYSVLICVIGLSAVQSQQNKGNQSSNEADQPGLDTGTVPPTVHSSVDDQFLNNHNHTETKALLPILVLHGESDVLSVSNMSDTKNIRLPPLLNQSEIDIYSVDFHWSKGFIFYSTGKNIFRANFKLENHSLSQVISQVIANNTLTARLAVDWVHDRLFWMSDEYQTVEVADLDGGNRVVIIDNVKPFKYPNNIAVDPYENSLFFVSDYSVFKSSLDGSHVERLPIESNTRGKSSRGVRCIALDRQHRRLYLTGENHTNTETNTSSIYIAYTNYDGSKLVELEGVAKARNWSVIFGIDMFRDSLYLAHYNLSSRTDVSDSLWTADLITNKTEKRFVPKKRKSVMFSIRVFHPQVQIKKQLLLGPV